MKTAFIFFGTGFILLLLLFSKTYVPARGTTIDIHLHDTFFVFSYAAFTILITLILGTLFSLGGIIGTRFRKKLFIFLFLFFAAVDAYYIIHYFNFFNS